ncbi:hypothetical protein L1887_55964 [Cichorium endivia]|nr:hypothetical protein L1887_55964 [Cichorium endivia]
MQRPDADRGLRRKGKNQFWEVETLVQLAEDGSEARLGPTRGCTAAAESDQFHAYQSCVTLLGLRPRCAVTRATCTAAAPPWLTRPPRLAAAIVIGVARWGRSGSQVFGAFLGPDAPGAVHELVIRRVAASGQSTSTSPTLARCRSACVSLGLAATTITAATAKRGPGLRTLDVDPAVSR